MCERISYRNIWRRDSVIEYFNAEIFDCEFSLGLLLNQSLLFLLDLNLFRQQTTWPSNNFVGNSIMTATHTLFHINKFHFLRITIWIMECLVKSNNFGVYLHKWSEIECNLVTKKKKHNVLETWQPDSLIFMYIY